MVYLEGTGFEWQGVLLGILGEDPFMHKNRRVRHEKLRFMTRFRRVAHILLLIDTRYSNIIL